MGDRHFVLDSSAVLALIENEAGADRVEQAIREEPVLIPWLVLMEVYYISQQEEGEAEAARRHQLLKELPADILWQVDEEVVLTAARFKASFRLSLADALIAAYANQNAAILLHKDPEYEPLAAQIALEALPYKPIR